MCKFVGFSPTKYVISTTFSKNFSCFLKKDILPHEGGAKTTEMLLSVECLFGCVT
jgi:hypothetical protein